MVFHAFNAPRMPILSKLGFRSSLVLAKLGFDLRTCYRDVLDEPLPEELGRLVNRLDDREVPRASLR